MITLKNDVLSIEVDEKNPIYKALSRFVGEFFIVHQEEGTTIPHPQTEVVVEEKPKLPETLPVIVNTTGYLDGLNAMFLDEKSVSRSILLTHAQRFFGTNPPAAAPFLVVADTRHDWTPTLVRIIDDKVYYATVDNSRIGDA